MNGLHLTKMTSGGYGDDRPRLALFAEWFIPMGFVPDTLVQFLPEPGGMSFTLCENVPKYSELARTTREKGGSLIHVNMYSHRGYPCLSTGGHVFKRVGLACGDMMLIRYEYGFIKARKLPHGTGEIVTARLFGKWLEGLGFVPNAVLTADSVPGLITCRLQENGLERTHELVKYARVNKFNLIQVQSDRDNNGFPEFVIPPSRLEKAGFPLDDAFVATCEYGLINISRIDFEALGF